jgi:prepilin-type N-terminal cleavage/methylation domain-containing protein
MMNRTLSRGFTLIELMMSTAILLLVMGAAFGFWRFFSGGYSFSLHESQSAFEAETTLAQLVREMRQVRVAEDGAYALARVEDFALTFYTDIDDDGVTDRVAYWLENGEFWRGVIKPTGDPLVYDPNTQERRLISNTVINEANEPVFTYYNQDWPADVVNNPLVPSSRQLATRYIDIYLKLRAAEGSGVPTIEVSSGVALRTLKSNL